MVDLKKVYQAISEEEAMNNLILFKDKWGKTYPSCVKSWEENWDILSTFFAYPPEVRKIIYTTNIIEGLNRQFRQITKNKPSFTNDDSLRKMLYLASQKIVERWTQRCRNWDIVLSQLSIIFEDRIPAWFAPENRISCLRNEKLTRGKSESLITQQSAVLLLLEGLLFTQNFMGCLCKLHFYPLSLLFIINLLL